MEYETYRSLNERLASIELSQDILAHRLNELGKQFVRTWIMTSCYLVIGVGAVLLAICYKP